MSASGLNRTATVDDLYQVDGKAELVDGQLVRMPPTGGEPSQASLIVAMSLFNHARCTGQGVAVGDNCGFLVDLPHRQSFSPDAAFWIGAKPTMKFYRGAPVFAVEIRSEHDYGQRAEREMAGKRADYFAAGCLVVWDVDLRGWAVIRSYRAEAPDQPLLFHRDELADAEPALPGWRFSVNELFDSDCA
jgi:Uma2 family endonuclease